MSAPHGEHNFPNGAIAGISIEIFVFLLLLLGIFFRWRKRREVRRVSAILESGDSHVLVLTTGNLQTPSYNSTFPISKPRSSAEELLVGRYGLSFIRMDRPLRRPRPPSYRVPSCPAPGSASMLIGRTTLSATPPVDPLQPLRIL